MQLVYSLFSDHLFSIVLQSNFAHQRVCLLWDAQNSDSLPSFLKACGQYDAIPSASGSMHCAVMILALICIHLHILIELIDVPEHWVRGYKDIIFQ